MKRNLTSVLIALLISAVGISQKNIIEKNGNKYYTNSDLNNFIGTWQLMDSIQHFKIRLLPTRIDMENIYVDMLLGYYSYAVDGNLITNTINTMRPFDENEDRSYGDTEDENQNVLLVKFWDAEYKKNGTARMTFLNDEKTKVKWTLGNYEREQIMIFNKDNPYRKIPDGYSVPTEMILEKVKE